MGKNPRIDEKKNNVYFASNYQHQVLLDISPCKMHDCFADPNHIAVQQSLIDDRDNKFYIVVKL